MPVAANLQGEVFGAWVVIAKAPNRGIRTAWLCRCVCGVQRDVLAQSLVQGRSTNCGCIGSARRAKSNLKHGLSNSDEYRIHSLMVQRCHNQNCPGFKWYGAKGVRVCAAWRDSFEQFFADMGPRPSKSHSIDRIDNSVGYEPGNCRWATLVEQANNKTTNKRFDFNGETLTLAQAVAKFGGNYSRINGRILRGHSVEDAFHSDGVVFHDPVMS